VGDAKVRVFFPPESKDHRKSIDAVVQTVRKAKSSVMFCLFMPTDAELRRAIFKAGDKGKMMFGLVNKISDRGPGDEVTDAAGKARVEIYHRSRRNKDVFSHNLYAKKDRPLGFWWEEADLPGARSKWPVYIHHKFVVIDAETDQPTIYTGSANMSKNALYRNDENMMEIKDCPRLAGIYLTEFLRLYEHYRARAAWRSFKPGKSKTYRLQEDSRWAKKYYTPGRPEYKSRVKMVGS
jgi:phosphatidylserine/phosphatidylglycerophosphate/cardiolipin synthase-like enzyme